MKLIGKTNFLTTEIVIPVKTNVLVYYGNLGRTCQGRGQKKNFMISQTYCPKLYLFFEIMHCWFTVVSVPEFEEHPRGGSFSRSLHSGGRS